MAQKRYKNYADKKAAQKGGSYNGNSPFFENIPEFQYIKSIQAYSHLREILNFRISNKNEKLNFL